MNDGGIHLWNSNSSGHDKVMLVILKLGEEELYQIVFEIRKEHSNIVF